MVSSGVRAPKPAAGPAPARGLTLGSAERARLHEELRHALGDQRAAMLREWVALIGETVPWTTHDGQESCLPTEYAIGHAVRLWPAEAAVQFGVSIEAVGRFSVSSDAREPLTPGATAQRLSGGLARELERIGDTGDLGESGSLLRIARWWWGGSVAALPVFGAYCDVERVRSDDARLLAMAWTAHRSLSQAQLELETIAGTAKKDRHVEMIRRALKKLAAEPHERAPTWVYYNLPFKVRNLVDATADAAGIDLAEPEPFAPDDRGALLKVLGIASAHGGNRPRDVCRQHAEIVLRSHYLELTERKRPDYTKSVGYMRGDGCPYVGGYIDFLRRVGRHYPIADGKTLADLLPWQLKKRR